MGAAGALGLAGCAGDGGEDGTPTEDGDGDPTPTTTESETAEIKEGGTLNVAVGANPKSFDPPYSSDTTSTMVQNLFFEGLIASDGQGNIYPWLAESYELLDTQNIDAAAYADYMSSVPIATDDDGNPFIDTEEQIIVRHPDTDLEADDEARVLLPDDASEAALDGTFGMQFRYNLHEGVTFTNGEEMTSENVVASVKRIENSTIAAQTFDTVLTAEAVDEYTVDLYAQEPDAEAERLLPQTVFTVDQAELRGGDLDPRRDNPPIGTGPWQFESFEDDESLVVSRRDDYWLEEIGLENKEWWDGPEDFPAAPVLDEINIRVVKEDATRAGALQEGETDLTYGLTAETLTNFDESEDFGVRTVEAGGYLFMQYPVQIEPWDNKKVRQAANHLIPRQQIVNNIEQGWARPAWTPVPRVAYGAGTQDPEALADELKPQNEYNPERAAELIEEAGVDTPIEIQIETNANNQDRVRKAEVITEAMNNTELFDATIETFEWGDFVGRIISTDYWDKGNALIVGLSGTFNPGSFCNATHHSRNWGQCCNSQKIEFEELDQMMDDARFSTEVLGDVEERASRYDEIWHEVVDLSANSYIDISTEDSAFSNEVKGFNPYPFNEGFLSFGLHAPYAEQVTWVDRE